MTMSLPNTFLIYSLLCLALQTVNVSAKISISKERNLEPTDRQIKIPVVFDDDSIESTKIAYMYCRAYSKTYQECEVLHEKYNFNGSISNKNSCRIVLRPSSPNGEIADIYRVIPFDVELEDKALVLWVENKIAGSSSVKTAVLKLRDVHVRPGCGYNYDNEIPLDKYRAGLSLKNLVKMIKILTYKDDTYDVIIPDYKLCGWDQFCRMTYTFRGTRIAGLTSWFSSRDYHINSRVYQIEAHSNTKGHLVVSDYERDNIALLIPGHGEWNIRLSLKLNETNLGTLMISAVDNNLIGLCSYLGKVGNPIVCTQYDLQGEKVMPEVHMKRANLRIIHYSLYNLLDGGLLLGSVAQVESGLDYQITKIDDQGEQYRPVTLSRLECEDRNEFMDLMMSNIFMNDAGEYCVTFACRNRHLKILVQCFTEKSLSKKLNIPKYVIYNDK